MQDTEQIIGTLAQCEPAGAIAETVEETAQVVAPVTEAVDKFAGWGWTEMLETALIGFSLVFCVLVIMIFVMKAFGYVFTARKKETKQAVNKSTPKASAEEETVAAIATAIGIYNSRPVIRITARSAKSAWNSKEYGLTRMPR